MRDEFASARLVEGRVKVRLDTDVCQGHGICSLIAPEVFVIDEETGLAQVREDMVGEDRRSAIAEAVNACPVRAIALVDG